MRKVKVAIIGAGTAGLSARREVEKVTKDYVVIDDGPMGTTCARVGCMPSKVLIQAANDFHRRHVLEQEGIFGGEGLTIDHGAVMKHVRKLRDRFAGGVVKAIDTWKSEHLIAKRAQFESNTVLDLGDEKIEAEKVIIATGSTPILPGPWREFQDHIIDTNDFFELETLPKRVAVIGLGVIGIELGQALHRLGVEMVGIGLGKEIGGLSDPEVQAYAASKLSEEMTLSFEGVEGFEKTATGLLVKTKNESWEVDKVLVAVGRSPNVKNIGLENTDAVLDERGIPRFNPNTAQIDDLPIYIAGDVNSDRPILHEAADEGRIAGYNAVHESAQCFQRRTSLGITFSAPNIATVGARHKELTDQNVDFVTGQVSFEGQGRSLVKIANKGLLKIYADRKSGTILGAEMIAPEGEHLAHLIAWTISWQKNVHEVLSLPFYHPVIEEGLRTAFRDVAGKVEKTLSPLETLRCQDHAVAEASL